MQPVRWEELSSESLAALPRRGIDMAILPVGATEQHGPHLPLSVDTYSAVAVAEGASARTGIPVLPALAYGCSLGHSKKWPGTLSLRPETLAHLVFEIGEWLLAAGFTRLLLLNGHVTNWAPLRCGLENIRHQYPDLRVALRSLWELSPAIHARYHEDAKNFHANCAETGLMLALRPELVAMHKAVDEPDRAVGHMFSYTMDKECVHGVVGAPSRARPEDGATLLASMIDTLAGQLKDALTETTPLESWATRVPNQTSQPD